VENTTYKIQAHGCAKPTYFEIELPSEDATYDLRWQENEVLEYRVGDGEQGRDGWKEANKFTTDN